MSSARVLRRTARAREQGGAFQIALAPLSEADATQLVCLLDSLVQRFVEGWIRLDNGIIQESRRTSLQRYIRALNNDARAAPNSPGPGDGLGRRGRNGRGGRNRRGGRTRRGGRNGRGRGGAESTDDNDGSEDDGNGLEDDGDEPADNDPDVLNDGNGQDIPGGVGDAAGTENEGQDGQL
ncbi:MAG: hypothetical protein LQ343_006750, partial [Gyalolechia ehrenbergii]